MPKDFLPTITACFSKYYPQTWIWWIGMAFPLWPRLVVPWLYKNGYENEQFLSQSKFLSRQNILRLATIAYWADILENVMLVGISYVVDINPTPNSTINSTNFVKIAHYLFFGTFLLASLFYTSSTLLLHFNSKLHFYQKTITYKKYLGILYFSGLAGAPMFLFYLLEDECQNYAKTIFAIFEYVIVLANLGLHVIQALDFSEYDFAVVLRRDVKLILKGYQSDRKRKTSDPVEEDDVVDEKNISLVSQSFDSSVSKTMNKY